MTALVLAGCGGEPEVDWSGVPLNQRSLIEAAVSEGDCQKMQTYFDGSEASDVLAYLDWHMEEAGCYE